MKRRNPGWETGSPPPDGLVPLGEHRVTRGKVLAVYVMVLTASLPAGLAAQGTVSSQGLGYPPGQLSTMARGAGGAFG